MKTIYWLPIVHLHDKINLITTTIRILRGFKYERRNEINSGPSGKIHHICPPILHNLCFSFFLCNTAAQEKLKTILMQFFFFLGGGGGMRCIMGDVQVANSGQVLNFV